MDFLDKVNAYSYTRMLKWIKGLPDDEVFPRWDMCSCPLAEYLTHIMGHPVEVTDNLITVFPASLDHMRYIPLPGAVVRHPQPDPVAIDPPPRMVEFVERFDNLEPHYINRAFNFITKAQVIELLEKLIEENKP